MNVCYIMKRLILGGIFMLSKTFAAITAILYGISLLNIVTKVVTAHAVQQAKNDALSYKDAQEIKSSSKKVVIVGLISCALSIFNAYNWNEFPYWMSAGLAVVIAFLSVILFVVFIGFWAATPSVNSLETARKNKQKYEELSKKKNAWLSSFHVDKNIFCETDKVKIAICSQEKQLLIYKDIDRFHNSDFIYTQIPFNQIIDCEILEDNATIMKGGIGRAVVGSMIAGDTGAIVGAATRQSSNVVNSLNVRIITNNIKNPCYLISIVNAAIERGTPIYKDKYNLAQEIYSTIVAIIYNNKNQQTDV